MNCLLSHFLISSVAHYDKWLLIFFLGFPGASVVNNPPANVWDTGSTLLSGRSSGEGNGNPFQYSCLGNPKDREAWWATVHGAASVRYDLATKQQKILFIITFYKTCYAYVKSLLFFLPVGCTAELIYNLCACRYLPLSNTFNPGHFFWEKIG